MQCFFTHTHTQSRLESKRNRIRRTKRKDDCQRILKSRVTYVFLNINGRVGTPAQPGSPGIRLRLQPRRARISTPLPLREQTLPGPAPTWPAVAVLRAKEEKGGKENQESSSHSSFPNPLQAQLFSPGAESLHSAQAPAGFSDRIPPRRLTEPEHSWESPANKVLPQSPK